GIKERSSKQEGEREGETLTVGPVDESVAVPEHRQGGILVADLLLVRVLEKVDSGGQSSGPCGHSSYRKLVADDVVVADTCRNSLLGALDLNQALEAILISGGRGRVKKV